MSMNVFEVSYVFITLFIIYYVYCRFCIQYSSLYSVLQNDNNASFAMFLYCFANYSGWSHTAAPLPRVLLLYCSLQLHCPQGFAGYSGLCPANPGQRFRGHLGIVSSKPGTAGSFRFQSNFHTDLWAIPDFVQKFLGYQIFAFFTHWTDLL